MVPQGPPTPLGGGPQPIQPSLLRSNSSLLGGHEGGMPSQNSFAPLGLPHTQFNNINMLGNVPNRSFVNGGLSSGLSGLGTSQRGLIESGAEPDPLSNAGNGVGFNPPSTSYAPSSITTNQNSTSQVQGQQQFANLSGNQMVIDHQQTQQFDPQNFQQNQHQLQQFSAPSNPQQQQQLPTMRAGLGGIGPVKLEPRVMNDQTLQQLQVLRNLGTVKLEPQQMQGIRSLPPAKMEPQHSDQSLFLHQQQQQQQQLLMSRQSSQVATAAQIQRLMQLQHQQQPQLLKAMPPQMPPLQTQFQPNLPIRSPIKPVYEPGTCARRLTHYMYQQQHRPEDNNIEFWRKFVAEYFAPNAKKRWCVSMYGSGRQAAGVFPQDVWHCEICNRKPGRGFEATVEVLPRLFKIKYESGILEELLYVDMPREYQNLSGQIVLDYSKAIQESVFEQLRVVRDGQLRIVFSPDLKICSWEFCARRHEELIPRRLLIPQVSQLGAAAQKYQAATQNASTNVSVSELQNNCNMFVASARQLAKALEVPLVHDLGCTKRYVRCLQISEVVNSMKDLIDFSRETGTGPVESLAKIPRRTNTSPGSFQGQLQQSQQQQQTVGPNSKNDSTAQAASVQLTSTNNIPGVKNSLNPAPGTSSTTATVGLHHQNSSRQNLTSNANSPFRGNPVQMPSPGSSNTMPQPSPHFQPPMPSTSNNPPQSSHGAQMNSANSPNNPMQLPTLTADADANDSQSSVQKILHDMMMSNQFSGGGMTGIRTMGSDVKNINGMLSSDSAVIRSGVANNNPVIGGGDFRNTGNGFGHSAMANGIQAALGSKSMNGRAGGMTMARDQSAIQQQDLGNQLLGGLGAVNGFNNLQFN
ncbi:Hypothetical predicted protein [Olea europaea subsp. europaea]|uniref:Transcriptional corepressor SEUSS n=1 Tax=Olea europaea subsp. europaea TaxID=158383 RepID=A0A8S0RL03_OLEEU|nr:Hypothetical predicted protein [Olea europaea subsp. europaea]